MHKKHQKWLLLSDNMIIDKKNVQKHSKTNRGYMSQLPNKFTGILPHPMNM